MTEGDGLHERIAESDEHPVDECRPCHNIVLEYLNPNAGHVNHRD